MLQAKAWLHLAYMQFQECIDAGRQGAELLSGLDEHVAVDNLTAILDSLERLGRPAEAKALAERLEPFAVRLGHAGALFFLAGHRFARALSEQADFDACFQEAENMLRHSQVLVNRDSHHMMAGISHFLVGRLEESTQMFTEATAAQTLSRAGTYTDGDAEGHLFLCHAWAKRRDAAMRVLESISAGLPRVGEPVLAGRCWRLLCTVEGLANLEGRERAASLHELVLQCLGTGLMVRRHGYGLARTVAGISAGCADRWDEAEEHFATALHQANELPHVIEQAEVRRWWAWTLLHRGGDGDRDRAGDLLGNAIEIYERLGMPIHLERALALRTGSRD
jgi:tetratricopeptide (TPR) repeat protein